MYKEDARTLDPAAQEEKRKTAVRLSKRGFTHKAISEHVGVHYLTVGRWLAKYRDGGMKALLSQVRGRRLGSGRQLDAEQEKHLQRLLIDK
ncbi:MAG: helix-turn-helix domain-containing protein, partial [Xanthomonadales bacterium]|nr:helix-turn-helix domain-containing protein [Xanthomonadales bacterium]